MIKHCALFAVLALALVAPAHADTPTFDLTPLTAEPAPAFADLAPMDEEFGRLKLTPLGVANTITAAGARFADTSTREELASGAFAFAIDALRDWEHQYPRDPWIAKDLARIAHVYARLRSDAAHDFAQRTVAWLERDYPASDATRQARGELERSAPHEVDQTFATLVPPPVPVQASAPAVADAPPAPTEAWQHFDAARTSR